MPRGSKYADYRAFNLPIDEQLFRSMNNRMSSDLAGQLEGKILSGVGA